MLSTATTAGAAVRWATAALAAGATPRLDAEVLLAHVLGLADRAHLIAHPERPLSPPQQAAFTALVERRRAHEPVAYLVGEKGFRTIVLSVDARVLVPRPCTETLVELAVAELPHGARVVDVGTGSGAIACALAVERPDLSVMATERSPDALAVARVNVTRLAPDVVLLDGDLLAPLAGSTVDAVLANLPYVPDTAPLPPDVRAHEPAAALFAGRDGLDAYRRLLATGAGCGARWIALEHGDEQAEALAELVRAAGFERVRCEPELDGRPRVVVGERAQAW